MRIWLTGRIATPWIMTDELIYSEMAKSFASSGHFLIRGAPSDVVSVAYPALISPAWWLHPMSTTYGVAKALNVVLMTAAAVPLFLWARRLVSPLWAVVAVALTLLLPSFVYTGMLMTENAFLPAFVLAAFAFAAALERPTLLRQGLAFAAILLASLVRLQGLVLVAVLPTAILLKVLFELRAAPRQRPWRFVGSELRRYWLSGALLAVGAVVYVLREVASGHSLSSGLGSYQAVAHGGYSLGEVRHWVLLHFAELPLSAGVLPVCAFLVLLGLAFRRGGTRSEAERAFLAVTTASIAWIVVEVAAFASRFSLRIEERYMFFLAPLLFLAFVLWLDRGLPRPPRAGDDRGGRSGGAVLHAAAGEPPERLDLFGHVRVDPVPAPVGEVPRRDPRGASLPARRRDRGRARIRALAAGGVRVLRPAGFRRGFPDPVVVPRGQRAP